MYATLLIELGHHAESI